MQVDEISVFLPQQLVKFLEVYKDTHNCKSRSQVIELALHLLQEKELETAYSQANEEIPEWDITVADGLKDEAW